MTSLPLLLSMFIALWLLWLNYVFIIAYISMFCIYTGVIGGRWLWKMVKGSPSLKNVILFITIIGSIGILFCSLLAIMGDFIFFIGNESVARTYVMAATLAMLFGTCYNIGYLVSIWNYTSVEEHELLIHFDINKKMCLIVTGTVILYIILVFIACKCLVALHIINQESVCLLRKYLLCGIGIFIGWIVWEHLKPILHFNPTFHRKLRLYSIIFTFIIGILALLGCTELYKNDMSSLKCISLKYSLLVYILAGYFIGLVYEVVHTEHVRK